LIATRSVALGSKVATGIGEFLSTGEEVVASVRQVGVQLSDLGVQVRNRGVALLDLLLEVVDVGKRSEDSRTLDTSLHRDVALHGMGAHSRDASVLADHVVRLITVKSITGNLTVALRNGGVGVHNAARQRWRHPVVEEAVATVRDANGCQGVHDVDREGLVGVFRVIFILDVKDVRAKKSLSGSIDTGTEASSVINRLENGGSAIRMTEMVGTDHVIMRHGEGFLGEIEMVLLLEPLEEL
jgi:hypothetical protein